MRFCMCALSVVVLLLLLMLLAVGATEEVRCTN